jgi:anti-anti-sigma factor
MGVEFQLTQEQPEGQPQVVIFHLAGWLDAQNEGRLVEAVQKAVAGGAAYVLLDLRELDTITSAGIRAVQRSFQIVTPKGTDQRIRRLKLCSASPRIYEVLNVTGLLAQVPVYESQDIAVDSFGK